MAAIAAVGLFSFTFMNGTIKGKISPSAAATGVWAIAGMDTIKVPVNSGMFTVNEVKPGTYKLVVQAIAPYRNFEKEGVVVGDGGTTDVGELVLQQ